jgi:hypothetical protein
LRRRLRHARHVRSTRTLRAMHTYVRTQDNHHSQCGVGSLRRPAELAVVEHTPAHGYERRGLTHRVRNRQVHHCEVSSSTTQHSTRRSTRCCISPGRPHTRADRKHNGDTACMNACTASGCRLGCAGPDLSLRRGWRACRWPTQSRPRSRTRAGSG